MKWVVIYFHENSTVVLFRKHIEYHCRFFSEHNAWDLVFIPQLGCSISLWPSVSANVLHNFKVPLQKHGMMTDNSAQDLAVLDKLLQWIRIIHGSNLLWMFATILPHPPKLQQAPPASKQFGGMRREKLII